MKRLSLLESPFGLSWSSFSSTSTCSDSKELMTIPGSMGFVSAHTLINRERAALGLKSLRRNLILDDLCRTHAQRMADESGLSHCVENKHALRQLLDSDSVGENIQRGPCVNEMHIEAMRAGQMACKNILSEEFVEFGVGTAKGKDGKLYMTQLFRGTPSTKRSTKEAVASEEPTLQPFISEGHPLQAGIQ